MSFIRHILLSKKAHDHLVELSNCLHLSFSAILDFCIFQGYSLPIKNDSIANNNDGVHILKTTLMNPSYASILDQLAADHRVTVDVFTTYMIDQGTQYLTVHVLDRTAKLEIQQLISAHEEDRKKLRKAHAARHAPVFMAFPPR